MSILVVDNKLDKSELAAILASHYPKLAVIDSPEGLLAYPGHERAKNIKTELVIINMEHPQNIIDSLSIIQATEYYTDNVVFLIIDPAQVTLLNDLLLAESIEFIIRPLNEAEIIMRVRKALIRHRDITGRKVLEEELFEILDEAERHSINLLRISAIDSLTGINNRRYCNDALPNEWLRAVKSGSELTALMIDVDFFKNFNDIYGHPAGDNCLAEIAGILNEELTLHAGWVARYGGEEFLAVLPFTGINEGLSVAENLRQAVEKRQIPHKESSAGRHVTVSIGAACLVPSGNDYSELIRLADKALYAAKASGRNKVIANREITSVIK